MGDTYNDLLKHSANSCFMENCTNMSLLNYCPLTRRHMQVIDHSQTLFDHMWANGSHNTLDTGIVYNDLSIASKCLLPLNKLLL